MKKPNRIIQLSVLLALAGGTAGVWAAGFALMEQNASGLGNSYAGQAAAAEDASTIFWNPAGMTRLPGSAVNRRSPSHSVRVKFSGARPNRFTDQLHARLWQISSFDRKF